MMFRKRRLGFVNLADQGSLDTLTPGGKVFVCALLFCLHGAISIESPLIQLFAALLAILLVTAATGYLFRPRLHVHAHVPAMVTCEEPLELTVTLRHALRRASDLLVDLAGTPSSWKLDRRPARIGSLLPKQSVVVPLVVRPTRRGVFPLPPVRVTSTFPLNLFRFRRNFPLAGEVLVTPAYRPLKRFDLIQRQGGAHAEQFNGTRAGGSEDYLGNREYLPGIAVRRWDYCSWARLGRPVVREYQNEGQVTATLVVDTITDDPLPEDQTSPEFEGLLSLAASISDALASEACRIQTLVVGSSIISPPGTSLLDQHCAILERLALVRPTPAEELADVLAEVEEFSQPGLVFVLLNGWNERTRAIRLAAEGPGRQVCGLVIGDAPRDLPSEVRHLTLDQVSAGEVEIL